MLWFVCALVKVLCVSRRFREQNRLGFLKSTSRNPRRVLIFQKKVKGEKNKRENVGAATQEPLPLFAQSGLERGHARVQSVCHNLFSCLLIFLDISYFQLERLLRFLCH